MGTKTGTHEKSESSSATNTTTTTNNEQIGAEGGGIAIRGGEAGEDIVQTLNITNVPGNFLETIASGASQALDQNFQTTQQALDQLGGIKALEVSGGATETNKTILIGLGIGLGALVLLKLTK